MCALPKDPDKELSVQDMADYLGVSRRQIYKLINESKTLPSSRYGRRHVIKQSALRLPRIRALRDRQTKNGRLSNADVERATLALAREAQEAAQ